MRPQTQIPINSLHWLERHINYSMIYISILAEECNAEVTSVEPDNNGTSTIPETNGTSTIPETNVTTTTGNTTFTTDHTQGFTTMEVTSAAPENTTTFTTDHTQGFTTMEVTSAAPATPRPDSPPVNSYNVKGENGTCIMLQGGIQFQIPYNNTHKQVYQSITCYI